MYNFEKDLDRCQALNVWPLVPSAEEYTRRLKDPSALPTEACLPSEATVHVVDLEDDEQVRELRKLFEGRSEMSGHDANFRNLMGKLVSQEEFGLLRGTDMDKVLSLKKEVRVCLDDARHKSRLTFYKLAQRESYGFGPGVHV